MVITRVLPPGRYSITPRLVCRLSPGAEACAVQGVPTREVTPLKTGRNATIKGPQER